ncbi:hypothetical protein K461DRAFT_262655 [Myriangium duriaei CBS 260.36]|uniref:RING-type domain-containing protein n=1 Tax=Myriangium duriaei CBS 260.36 TaxID=1168546 RepID=A0A9P4IX46_9PEZI|nr:hypothetical protein K461DRAFT_262655 [Myriangium duriaei CBS 260.36]
MAATSILLETVFLSNPNDPSTATQTGKQVNSSISYSSLIDTGITTLSTNLNSLGNSPNPAGFVYVPTLIPSDPCINESAPYIPANVTRISNIPGSHSLIALAPWLSPSCVQSYLGMGRHDAVKTFIFFLPNRTAAAPPTVNDPAWSLGDGGHWKNDNQYPVYAITTDVGNTLMNELNLYSGNISSVPNGAMLETQWPKDGFIRVAASINLNLTSGLPSLWIFLVIILAVLILVVGIISAIMHLVQRRRRHSLRRRVTNGEVDLETLGVKRVMVPKEVLEKMPVYVYEKTGSIAPAVTDDTSSNVNSLELPSKESDPTNAPKKATKANRSRTLSSTLNHFDQPTCAICLDDFVPAESRVRQLPCNHIFHPECVDVFLTQNSSLCPLCKKTSLPAGFCPTTITNTMVRRERILRQARQRANRVGFDGDPDDIIRQRNLRTFMLRRRAQDIEMNPRAPAPSAIEAISRRPSQPIPAQGPARREWIRRRIEAMTGPGAAPRDPDREQESRPIWRRTWRRVFPSA